MNIDNKLKEILDRIKSVKFVTTKEVTNAVVDLDKVRSNMVAKIKQLFADEGYEKKIGLIGNISGIKLYSINGDSNIMAGQEWYDRFEKELDKWDRIEIGTNKGETDFMAIPLVLKAAKKASGL